MVFFEAATFCSNNQMMSNVQISECVNWAQWNKRYFTPSLDMLGELKNIHTLVFTFIEFTDTGFFKNNWLQAINITERPTMQCRGINSKR